MEPDWAEAIRMEQEGHKPGEIAEAIGVKLKNFRRGLNRAIKKGWTAEGPPSGDEEPEDAIQSHTGRMAELPDGAIQAAIQSHTPSMAEEPDIAIQGAIQEPDASHTERMARMAQFDTEEEQELREILSWWKARKQREAAIQSHTPSMAEELDGAIQDAIQSHTLRVKQTFRIDAQLYELLQAQAKDEGRSMTEVVDAALRAYLGA